MRAVEGPRGTFEFSGLSRELEALQQGGGGREDWASDFMREQPMIRPDGHFEEFEKIYQRHRARGPYFILKKVSHHLLMRLSRFTSMARRICSIPTKTSRTSHDT